MRCRWKPPARSTSAGVDARVSRIVDLKAPGSGEFGRNRWQNLALLTANDELKFVLKDRADYEWARQLVVDCAAGGALSAALLPGRGELAATTLADWILADRLPVRFQLQLAQSALG
jgi:7-carboxy-7-deazaguanine synthase